MCVVLAPCDIWIGNGFGQGDLGKNRLDYILRLKNSVHEFDLFSKF